MTLHWAAQLVWKKLPKEFHDKLRSIRCHPFHDSTPGQDDFLPVCNGITGHVMLKWHGDSPIRVSRSKMCALFSEGLDIQVRPSLLCGRTWNDVNNSTAKELFK